MRGIYTNIVEIRQKVFTEVARLAYEGGDYSRIINLPYKIIPGEVATYRESVFLERAIVEERLRLAIGLPLRKMTEHAPVSQGIEESAIAEKYYDPPLVNIIKFACHSCPDNEVRVQQALSALSKGKTVIMIAHRLSSILGVDCIYVLQDGEIIESGTHRGLLEQNGVFARMWKNYSEAVEWSLAKEARA